MSDGKFFGTASASKVEIKMWKDSLLTNKVSVKKDTLKKVIAAMTTQRDVSSLFTDIVKHMPTTDMALKKLIYLYIINNAREHPEAAILCVNTFQKDADQANSPLIRALALRTMGCIRLQHLSEYLAEPLALALKDSKNAYVRKTAAVCVSKLYETNPTLVEDQGFVNDLRDMLSDPNHMVVSNALASLSEISNQCGEDLLKMDSQILSQLMVALQEATEWGVVFILDSLALYSPTPQEASDVIERCSPLLSHSNAAVCISAVRVIVSYMDKLDNPQMEQKLIDSKLPAPLVSLIMNRPYEIQYIALRNISLIIQRRPGILCNQVRNFFCKYNDPQYVKLEKLDIMVKLANLQNIDKVLMEFKHYCSEVDIEFVRRSVLAIGRCAIKLDKAAQRCVLTLMDLIANGNKYVIQETIVVVRDIFRKYPNQYEKIIKLLCRHLDVNEPDAKGALIWIIGEYSNRIDNASKLLDSFCDTFEEETEAVKLQLLTAVVKLYVRNPGDELCGQITNNLLGYICHQADNPDLRDRGYMYVRLLQESPAVAEAVVLAAKPVITDDDFNLSNQALDSLIRNIGTLASIYHQPPELFVKDGKKTIVFKKATKQMMAGSSSSSDSSESSSSSSSSSDDSSDDEGGDAHASDPTPPPPQATNTATPPAMPNFMDAFGGNVQADVSSDDQSEPGGLLPPKNPANSFIPSQPFRPSPAHGMLVVKGTAANEKGLMIATTYSRQNGQAIMHWLFKNGSSQALTGVKVMFDNNVIGAQPAKPFVAVNCAPNARASGALIIGIAKTPQNLHNGALRVKIQTNFIPALMFADPTIPAHIFFEEGGKMEKKQFLTLWGSIPEGKEVSMHMPTAQNKYPNVHQDLRARFEAKNVFYGAALTDNNGALVLYASIKLRNTPCLVEVKQLPSKMMISVKSQNIHLAGIALKGVHELITS